MRYIGPVAVFGEPADPETLAQAERCLLHPRAVHVALMADNHRGYSVPIGGVVAYDDAVSPAGVGYDIGCGNSAVCLGHLPNIRAAMPAIMDRVWREVNFGMGSSSYLGKDHPIFNDVRWHVTPEVLALRDLARTQIGSVGAGNHYVDIFLDDREHLWIGNHFGSRGFGHKTASGFLNLVAGRKWGDRAPGESMDQEPCVVLLNTALGQDYWTAMSLAGDYARAGRDVVLWQTANIVLATHQQDPRAVPFETLESFLAVYDLPWLYVRNNHNLAWKEWHRLPDGTGADVIVVRKGATPAFPGEQGFIGGSMGESAVIVEGRTTEEGTPGTWTDEVGHQQRSALYSTVHGAGRAMSRTKAAGKLNRKTGRRAGGEVTRDAMMSWVREAGVELRGGDVDEAPQAYKRLPEVLAAHEPTLHIRHVLHPIGVAMAGPDTRDDYKD